MVKDRFSQQASAYARYRPTYPAELFNYVFSFVNERRAAWDCATGNGQAAHVLANYFERVDATDVSEAQLSRAVAKENIFYTLCPAEKTPFADNSFDLITVATAYHWLNWEAFYTEATRVGKEGAVVAAWAYDVFYCSHESITAIINHFYHQIIKSYWDKERDYVNDRYSTVAFRFSPLPTKDFEFTVQWNKEAFLGYLSSWSAVQNYINQNDQSPLGLIEDQLQKAWPHGEEMKFHFPLFLRIGRVTK